jgi:hypothetical protein
VSGAAYERVLDALRDAGRLAPVRGAEATAHCPGPLHAHGDRHPGLSVTGVRGRVLVHCFAGCETADVLDALGLSLRDLYDDENGGGAVALDAVDQTPEPGETRVSGATYTERPRQPVGVTLADLALLLPGDDVATLLRLDRVPEPLRDAYLRTVGERLMWRQADTAARDLLTASAVAAPGLPTAADLMRPGGDYVLDSPALPVPVWGEAERVVMAEGESLMLLGRAGSGKTTLAQQWAMARNPYTLRTDLVLRLADARIEFLGESRSFFIFWRHVLPAPEPQYLVRDHTGREVARQDFAWPGYGVWLEFDGKEKYLKLLHEGDTTTAAVLREKRREDRSRELTGWRCIRITWADVMDPARTVARIRALLATASRAS